MDAATNKMKEENKIMVTKNKKENNEVIAREALNYYKEYDGNQALKAEQVKGKSLSELLTLCKQENAWHIGLVRKIVSAFGGNSYQQSLETMNDFISKIN